MSQSPDPSTHSTSTTASSATPYLNWKFRESYYEALRRTGTLARDLDWPWQRFLIVRCPTCLTFEYEPYRPRWAKLLDTALDHVHPVSPHVARRALARQHPNFRPLKGHKN